MVGRKITCDVSTHPMASLGRHGSRTSTQHRRLWLRAASSTSNHADRAGPRKIPANTNTDVQHIAWRCHVTHGTRRCPKRVTARAPVAEPASESFAAAGAPRLDVVIAAIVTASDPLAEAASLRALRTGFLRLATRPPPAANASGPMTLEQTTECHEGGPPRWHALRVIEERPQRRPASYVARWLGSQP